MPSSSLRTQTMATLVVLLGTLGQAASAAKTQLSWQPGKLSQGSPILFELRAPATTRSVSASWLGHEIVFFRTKGAGSWYGLAGIPAETVPGSYDLRITATRTSGKPVEIFKKLRISTGLPE